MSSTPYTSSFAAIAPRITGSLSIIASSLTIYVILLSRTKLSSVYHRIMFGMSVADIMGSFAMALTTLPMPKHLPHEEQFELYQFAGTRLGNTTTCNTQAFFFYFGWVAMYGYNASLCLYYACAIAFGMKEKTIVKYVEATLMHTGPIGMALGISLWQLRSGLYNPSPWQAWCEAEAYPYNCADNSEVDCIRGQKPKESIHTVWFIFIIIAAFIVIVALILVALSVHRTSRKFKQVVIMSEIIHRTQDCSRRHSKRTKALEYIKESNRSQKVVLIQALAYISAFVWTLLFPLLRIVFEPNPLLVDELCLVFMPAQGIFNFLIFLWQKVYSHSKVNPNTNRYQALRRIFCETNIEEPVLISRLAIVQEGVETGGHERRVVMEDETEEKVEISVYTSTKNLPTTSSSEIDNYHGHSIFKIQSVESYYSDGDGMLGGEGDSSRGGLSGFDDNNLSWGRSENTVGSRGLSFASN